MILFAWVKDSAGNISSPVVDTTNIVETISQFIELEKGWNIFSTYLIPSNLNFDSILQSIAIQNKLIEVLDKNGNTYTQNENGWTNNIGNIQISDGYKIRVDTLCSIEIRGRPVNLPYNIPLNEGWNLISFPYDVNVDAMEVVRPLINQGILEKVQDEKGESIEFWGDSFGWINGIGDFKSGEGYHVKVNTQGILPITGGYEKSGLIMSNGESESSHFETVYEGNGLNHMNINIIGLKERNLEVADEIAAFDGEICVGAVKLDETNINSNMVSILASSADGDILNGFKEGNKIDIKLWQYIASNESVVQANAVMGDMLFQNNGSVFLNLTKGVNTGIDDFTTMDFKIYPNPANDKITITFSVLNDADKKLTVADIFGTPIFSKVVTSPTESIDVSMLPCGTYLLKALVAEKFNVKKMVIYR